MRKIRTLLLLSGIALLVASCNQYRYENTILTRQKAKYALENEDYGRTNDALISLMKKYDCVERNSFRASNSDGVTVEAEYSLLVPAQSYDEFNEEFKTRFRGEIFESRLTREAISETAVRSKSNIKYDVEDEIRWLTRRYEYETNPSIKRIREAELNNKIKELGDLSIQTENDLSLIDKAEVYIVWRLKAPKKSEQPDEEGSPFPCGFKMPLPGPPPVIENGGKITTINNFGDIKKFSADEPLSINLEDFNFETSRIESDFDGESLSFKIEDNPEGEESYIYLTNKCQIVNIPNGTIPNIIPAGELEGAQIIITPRVDENCNQIGFEVRAGSIEAGCKNGKKNLIALKNCIKKNAPAAKPKEVKKPGKKTAVKKSAVKQQRKYNAKPDTIKTDRTQDKKKNPVEEAFDQYNWEPQTGDK